VVEEDVVEGVFAAVCFVGVDLGIVVDVLVAFCVKFVVCFVGVDFGIVVEVLVAFCVKFVVLVVATCVI
jgi:hypothetical protein